MEPNEQQTEQMTPEEQAAYNRLQSQIDAILQERWREANAPATEPPAKTQSAS